MTQISSFAKEISLVTNRFDLTDIFSDFLEITICCLSMGEKEDHYFKIIKPYKKAELEQFAKALAALNMEMDNRGEGLYDVLGPYFTEFITRGHNGQYFTPQSVCELMAQMTGEEMSFVPKRILDPTCGSGTMLIAKAKAERKLKKMNINQYFGADIDRRCAMMTAINFCLNGILGEVAWMDSLSNEFYGAWRIEIHPKHNIPYLKELTKDECVIPLKLKEEKKKEVPPIVNFESDVSESIMSTPVQGTLFSF